MRGNVRFSSWRVVGYEEINDPSGQTAAAMSVTATYAAGTTTSCVVTASRSTRFLESARAQHPRAIAWLTVNIGFPSGQANLEFMAVEIPSDDGRTVSALNVQARPLPSPAPSPTGRPRSASARR